MDIQNQQKQNTFGEDSVPAWSNVLNYNNHLAKLWDDSRLARLRINDSNENGYKALEDWFEAQKMLTDYISEFINDDILCEIDKNFALINKQTGDVLWVMIGDSKGGLFWQEIRKILSANERLLATAQARAKLFMHTNKVSDPNLYLQ